MYLLDTTFLIDYLKAKPEFINKLNELANHSLHISVISSAELMSSTKEHQEEEVNKFLDSFIRIPITDDLARKAGKARAELKRKGYKKPLADILIGQTALEYNLILVTGNPKDFPQLASRKLIMAFP